MMGAVAVQEEILHCAGLTIEDTALAGVAEQSDDFAEERVEYEDKEMEGTGPW